MQKIERVSSLKGPTGRLDHARKVAREIYSAAHKLDTVPSSYGNAVDNLEGPQVAFFNYDNETRTFQFSLHSNRRLGGVDQTRMSDGRWLVSATESLKASAKTLANEALAMSEAAAKLSAGGDRIDRLNYENSKLLDALLSS